MDKTKAFYGGLFGWDAKTSDDPEAGGYTMFEYAHGIPSWVDVATPDMDKTKAFYGGLFGWDAKTSDDPEAGGYTMFEIGGKPVAGAMPLMAPEQPPIWATYVNVDDADKTAEAVAAAGGTVMMPPMDVTDVGRTAYFLDPQGAPFGVWQARLHKGAALVNESGTLTWNELMARDIPGSKTFYSAVFGWDPNSVPFGAGEYTEWKVGGRPIGGMIEIDENYPPDLPANWLAYFAVDDCDAAVAKVVELGGEISVPPTDIPPGRFAVVADPNGGFFALITSSPEAAEAAS